jgi:hypothetical protein
VRSCYAAGSGGGVGSDALDAVRVCTNREKEVELTGSELATA